MAKPVRTDEQLPDELRDAPVFVLMQVGLLAQEWSAEALLPVGLSLREYTAMLLVPGMGIAQTMLAERLGVSESVLSRLVDRLEGEQLLARRPSFVDGRRRIVVLTEPGRELVAVAADEVAAVEAALTEHLSDETVARLAELAPPRLTQAERVWSDLAPPRPLRDWNDWERVIPA